MSLDETKRYLSATVGFRTGRPVAVGIFLFLLLIGLCVLAVSVGPYRIPLNHAMVEPLAVLGLAESQTDPVGAAVIRSVRLPRIVLAALVGGALAVSGAVLQGVFRNPMAEPGIIGVSSGASLGAVMVISTGLAASFAFILPASAFLGALVTLVVVYVIAKAAGAGSPSSLLLSGVAMGAFIGALVSVIILFEEELGAQREILFWLIGGFDAARWQDVVITAPFILTGIVVAVLLSRELNLLVIGEDEASSLGVRTGLVRNLLITSASLATGAAVAVSGILAFVGLIAPHAVRLASGPDNRYLLPLSALSGATITLSADTAARVIIAPAELPAGLISALLGAPFFLMVLARYRRNLNAL